MPSITTLSSTEQVSCHGLANKDQSSKGGGGGQGVGRRNSLCLGLPYPSPNAGRVPPKKGQGPEHGSLVFCVRWVPSMAPFPTALGMADLLV